MEPDPNLPELTTKDLIEKFCEETSATIGSNADQMKNLLTRMINIGYITRAEANQFYNQKFGDRANENSSSD